MAEAEGGGITASAVADWSFNGLMFAISMFNTIQGIFDRQPVGPSPAPEWLGRPWNVWIQAGLDGTPGNITDRYTPYLTGAGGPFPHVFLFNDVGHFLATEAPQNNNAFVKQNTIAQVSVYPNNVNEDENQDATFAVLSARDMSRNGLLVVEVGFGLKETGDAPTGAGPYSINGFTLQACGAPWYPSGIHRPLSSGGSMTLPGAWIGGEIGLGAIQIHGPSHMVDTTTIDIKKYRGTNESHVQQELKAEYCNRPHRLSFWQRPIASNDVKKSAYFDKTMTGNTTYEVTKDMKNKFPSSGQNRRAARRSEEAPHSHRKTLTIVENDAAVSATNVCASSMSFGPDYLNLAEGWFCRMEDRKLLPVCENDPHPDSPLEGECFDKETKQVVDQPTLQSLRQQAGDKVASNGPYDGEWRTSGNGWEHTSYQGK